MPKESLRVRIQTAMHKLGRSNGLSPPTSQDPMDELLHLRLVSDIGKSFFDAQRDFILDQIKGNLNDERKAEIDKQVRNAEKGVPGIYTVVETENYRLMLKTASPSHTLNETALRVALSKRGMPSGKVEEVIREATKWSRPSQQYIVEETQR